jgi:hypothetical protein
MDNKKINMMMIYKYHNIKNESNLDDIKNNKNNKSFDDNTVLNLLKTEYVIFLTNKFYNYYKFMDHPLLNYFKKYNVIYFNYNDKTKILQILELINKFIERTNSEDKDELIDNLNIKKLKLIYFLENNIEPNTLYKKISFSKEELFLSFDNYVIKKREYKLRTFCQIAEKLGAYEIIINSDIQSEKNKSITLETDTSIHGTGLSISNSKTNNENINLNFSYNNYNHNLNLNKFYLIELIKDEREFFISKEEFYSDIDLKFLIDARCLNLIQSYDTQIIINRVNELEKKIFVKAMSYGFNIGYSKSNYDYSSINISVKFIDIYNNPDCITGNNLYIKAEGFWHLKNIIKQQQTDQSNKYYLSQEDKKIYGKINNFLEAHMISLQKKHFSIKDDIAGQNVYNTYNHVIKNNFKSDEIDELFYEFFKDNLTYKAFEKFRNIMILENKNEINIDNKIFQKSTPDIINKFYFTSIQYTHIRKVNKKMWENIYELIKESISLLLETEKFLLFIKNEMLNNTEIKFKTETLFLNKLKLQRNKYDRDVLKNIYISEGILLNIELDDIISLIKTSDIIKIIYNGFKSYDFDLLHLDGEINEIKKISLHIHKYISANYKDMFINLIRPYDNILNKVVDNYIQTIFITNKNKKNSEIKPVYEDEINNNNHDFQNTIINKIFTFIIEFVLHDIIIYHNKNNAYYAQKNIINILILYFQNSYNQNKYNKIISSNILKPDNELEEILLNKLQMFTDIDKKHCISNYNEYKLFYTWDNFNLIINKIEENENDIKSLFLNPLNVPSLPLFIPNITSTKNISNNLMKTAIIPDIISNISNINTQNNTIDLYNENEKNINSKFKKFIDKMIPTISRVKKILKKKKNNGVIYYPNKKRHRNKSDCSNISNTSKSSFDNSSIYSYDITSKLYNVNRSLTVKSNHLYSDFTNNKLIPVNNNLNNKSQPNSNIRTSFSEISGTCVSPHKKMVSYPSNNNQYSSIESKDELINDFLDNNSKDSLTNEFKENNSKDSLTNEFKENNFNGDMSKKYNNYNQSNDSPSNDSPSKESNNSSLNTSSDNSYQQIISHLENIPKILNDTSESVYYSTEI